MATLSDDDDDNVAAVPAKDGADVEVEQDDKKAKEPEVEVVEDDGKDVRTVDKEDDEHDDEPGEKHQRQRETAAERRARAKLAKERDKRELDFQKRELLRQDALIKQLQKGQTETRVTDLDNRIATANHEANQFDVIFGKAITAQKGDDAREAARLRDEARTRAWEADQEKRAIIAQAQKQPAPQVPYLDKAQAFMAANPWYNANGNDADSKIVTEIDNAVAKDYIPTSDAYWNELQRRVQKNLPHRFSEDDTADDTPPTRQRKGPPTGGSSRSNSSTSTQIRLSPERVAAMKEAGVWDDPVQRARMAKAYANYDKNTNG